MFVIKETKIKEKFYSYLGDEAEDGDALMP